jgi:hypothetical protein
MGHEYKDMGHESANGGGRGLGYMLFNVHLCNQPCYCHVVVEPGTQLCTLLEVWVLGVGMSTLGRKRLCEGDGREQGTVVPLEALRALPLVVEDRVASALWMLLTWLSNKSAEEGDTKKFLFFFPGKKLSK